jgi:hypothetical protein
LITSVGDGAAASWLGSAYSSINSSTGDWLSQTISAQSSSSSGISGFLSQSTAFANLLASSVQTQSQSLNDIYAREAMLRIQEDTQKQLDQTMADLQDTQNAITNTTPDPVTTDSSATIDFTANTMTMRDGTVIDITSGVRLNPITLLPYAPNFVTKVKS